MNVEQKAMSNPILYQCAPNFSEGRRWEVVEEIASAVRATPDVRLLDMSADADHNRCVLTLLGEADGIRAAALAAARVAVARIDLRAHTGVHPRTGAIDVLPVVPLLRPENALNGFFLPPAPHSDAWNEAVALARSLGASLAEELNLPVYFYEWAAGPERRASLPDLRRGGFEAFASGPLLGERAPDLGPSTVHPTAGVVIVGARAPLVAYNINLDSPDIEVARAIARRIRAERLTRPELEGVRALGLHLASRNRAQVSLNLTRPERSPLPAVFAYTQNTAAQFGASAVESEIIGVIPQASLDGQPPEAILWHTYRPAQILDFHLPAAR